MATYHLSAKTISRSHGRSATAAAAYRAGARITDERTGLIHDYRRRRGVEARLLILPDDAPDWSRGTAAPPTWRSTSRAAKATRATTTPTFY